MVHDSEMVSEVSGASNIVASDYYFEMQMTSPQDLDTTKALKDSLLEFSYVAERPKPLMLTDKEFEKKCIDMVVEWLGESART